MIRFPAYPAHQEFVAPARASSQIWRLAVGLVLGTVAYFFLVQLFARTVLTVFGLEEIYTGEGSGPADVLIVLASFGCMAVAAGLSAKLLHQRGFATFFGPLPQAFRDFRAVSSAVVFLLAIIFLLPPWDMGGPLVPNLGFGTWLVLLLPSLVLIAVQVGAEEVVFRGYIQQQLAARFDSPWVWMVLPSVLFATLHYDPPSTGENALMIAIWAGIFGMLMADLTARSGSLGPAIAVHLWNNASAILLVSMPDNLSGLSLYLAPFSMADTEALRAWLPVDFALMLVMWLAARLALRR